MVTIILCHPWDGSFNYGVFKRVTKHLTANGKKYQVIDLHQNGFNPVFTSTELALYSQGIFTDPLIGRYQEILKNTREAIFIFPIWWMSMPAMLKVFFDKVMLVDFAWFYDESEMRLKSLLTIEKTLVVTTSEEPTSWVIEEKDGINGQILNCMTAVGFNNAKWLNCERVSSDADSREAFIQEVLAEL